MKKILIASILIIFVALGLNMKKHEILFSFGQFLMDCRMNDAAYFVMLSATHTNEPILKSKALTQMSRIAARHKRFDAGLLYALDAAKANPKNYDAWFMAAGNAQIIGSTKDQKILKSFDQPTMELMNERGLKYIDQAIGLNANDPTYYDTKIALLAKVGRLSEVKEILNFMAGKFPNYGGLDYFKKKQASLDFLMADKKDGSV